MEAAIEFLTKAADFKVISETTFGYNFNEFRGGSFNETIPEKVFAYNTEWKVYQQWIDRAWGDYYYEYRSKKEPCLPTKIHIEQSYGSMTGYTDTNEHIRFYGKLIFKQSDDWGRKNVIWLERFKEELESCETKEEVLKKIKQIQNREYFLKKKNLLSQAGFSKIQIKKLFHCKTANWKYELLSMKLSLINNSYYPKELFKRLSESPSNTTFNKLAKKWGLDELCEFSYPRKTNYTHLIYKLK